jgi:hypothetical protein
MGENGSWSGADPDELDHLADLLDRPGDQAGPSVAIDLESLFTRAAQLGVGDELASLRSLHTWAIEVAPQLRENAAILRGDSGQLWGEPATDPSPFITDPSPFNDGVASTYDLRVPGQDDANEFIRLSEQEELSEEDLRRMNQLLGEWDESNEFAAYLIDEMGMEEYLRLSQRFDQIDTLANSGDDNSMFTSLDTRMGNILTCAFQIPGDMDTDIKSTEYQLWLTSDPDGQRYQQRLDALRAIGSETLNEPDLNDVMLGGQPDPRLGYDVVFDLLDSADTQVPMSEPFFDQTMNHLIEMERANPDIWTSDRFPVDQFILNEDGDRVPNPEYGWGPENDATDRLLGLAANSNPDAVEAFFDPNLTNNLHYFIGAPENAPYGDGTTRYVTYGDFTRMGPTITSPGGYPGLNAALEAAATGHAPGTSPQQGDLPPSDTNARIAEQAWNTFADEYETASTPDEVQHSRLVEDGIFESLRPAMGQIAAAYIPSVQGSIRGEPIEPPGHPYPTFTSGGNRTAMLLYELGKDRQTYQAVTAANNAYTYVTVDHAVNGDWDSEMTEPDDRVQRAADISGAVAGIMTDAQVNSDYADQLEEDEAHNASREEAKMWTDISTATITGLIPHAGAAAAFGFGSSTLSNSIFSMFEADNSTAAFQQANRNYNESLTAHRDGVAIAAAMEAVGSEPSNFTADEIADIREGARNGAWDGFDRGKDVSQSPEDIDEL